ncbi:hypothetical protein PF005_g5072 [Phytophthora fragariae]|uniref:Uncharacterized protein n=2 Tax=Phytophthora TaxID=4783 RepID=A0A6A4A0A5_9STRA|nr:hypothetical protein PF003_g3753 [Phytophthora fragariae]KAE9024433.1 hypothetical protein PR001_g12681 [Phytophthora rubi]KAE8944849.1 hypothetical protein PF009_g5463 [Phytophthora fragariae]KAE9045266.1 hypothetical protein PR002_g2322 [Phytophthora rubi]KAE9115792.1 hypothetical protein PF010_g9195 [Phytophthora fragariae]
MHCRCYYRWVAVRLTLLPSVPRVLTVHNSGGRPGASRYSVSNKPAAEQLSLPPPLAMISPLKDIVIATVLGVAAGTVWNNWKDGEMDRISRFYKWYDAQEAQKNAHADD